MATVTNWNPFGVALNVTATAGTVTRKTATTYTVALSVSWSCYYSGNSTNYGMWVYANDANDTNKAITAFGSAHSSGSTTLTGTYSISGYGAQTKSITVTFENYNSDNGASAKKSITLSVSVPAWPSYTVKYNANGGSGAPSSQTKYKDVTLTLSSTKPTRTGYTFSKWNTASGGTGTAYSSGGSYTANAAATLYAQWTANTYTVTFNANGGSGGPGTATKTYGKSMTIPSTKPTRTNYNFLGWAESKTATTAQYSAGGTYSKAITANTTLYAVWELAYYKPIVKSLTVARCTEDGTLDDFGAYIMVGFKWECCQLTGSNPIASIVVKYKSSADTTYTEVAIEPNGTESGTQLAGIGGALSNDLEYTVEVYVTDTKGGVGTASKIVPTSAYAIDFLKGGKGVAIGKAADAEGFEVAMDSLFSGTVTSEKQFISTRDRTCFIHNHPTGTTVAFGVGASGEYHGVWSETMNKWLLYGDGNQIRTGLPLVKHLRSTNVATELTLTNSLKKLDMSAANYVLGSSSELTISDGGIKCNIDGYIRISGAIHVKGLTAGDTVAALFYKGTTSFPYQFVNSGSSTYVTLTVPTRVTQVSAGDIIYLYVRNYTASRGTVEVNNRTVLLVEYVG